MSLASPKEGAFRWSGSLKETSIRQLYERCQRLRLTGNMRLSQGAQTLDLTWIGGEPIENEGEQGTRSLPLWADGQFVVEQRIPDWKGKLTQGVELSGSLRAVQITAIYKLCSDNQLSAEVELLRTTGERAQVRFTLGKAEAAVIAGQTESAISAMSKLGGWTDGTFQISLRPAFGDEKAAEAPVYKASPAERFDVTGNIDLAKDPVVWPGGPSPSGVGSAKTPPATVAPTATPAKGNPIPPRLAQTLIRAPGAAGFSPMEARKLIESEAADSLPSASPSQRTSALVVVSIAVIALCAAAIVAVLLLR